VPRSCGRRRVALPLALIALILPQDRARAQVTAEIELQSDYRTRGYSLSDERAVATVNLGYDDLSGVYLGGALSGLWSHGQPRLLAARGYVGYAARLNRSVSADAGVIQTHYGASSMFGRAIDYTEFYAGVSSAGVSSHVFYSPDYYGTGQATIYAQIEGGVELDPALSLSGHLGHLEYLEQPPYYPYPSRQDWRLTAVRRVGRTSLSLALSGRIERGDNQDTALVAGVSRSF
jgi:uncharacterized protein (TIGR02001 family)